MGGIESHRPCDISMDSHVQWVLRYHDHRFRLHPTFAFVAYAILQKREAMDSAGVQIQCKKFEQQYRIISQIRPEDLQQAIEEECLHRPISNPAVKMLISHVHSTAARVNGSNSARYRKRTEVAATII